MVGSIPDGATVMVLTPGVADEQGIAWSQVRYDGNEGYSATSLLGDRRTPRWLLKLGTEADSDRDRRSR